MTTLDEWGRTIGQDRREATALGLRFYQGGACCHGHAEGVRYTSTGACVECVGDASLVRTRRVRKADRIRKKAWRHRIKAEQAAATQAEIALSPMGQLYLAALGISQEKRR